VIFGNGREGARLPTGMENVKALYRYGIGKPGNVRAEQISQLSTRPLGVKEVINPVQASGGADRESRDQARRNAPNAVMALDRLVSTRDYADFARSSAGIGKAASVELTDGSRTVVHVTIAGSDDIPIDPSSDLFVNLRRALRALGDPLQPVELEVRELLILVISVRIRIDPDYLWEKVATQVRTRLMTAFGFEQRDLGQDVTSSEVLSVIQSVRGVMYVDLESFGELQSMIPDAEAEGQHRAPTPEEIADGVAKVVAKSSPASRIIANMARPAADGQSILPAQLAVLIDAPATLVLNQIK
jgi:predicted phage baseplate assembly protein